VAGQVHNPELEAKRECSRKRKSPTLKADVPEIDAPEVDATEPPVNVAQMSEAPEPATGSVMVTGGARMELYGFTTEGLDGF
jgi:hypothetical protein